MIARAALLGALVLAAPASADPFGELPFRPVAGVATCVRATGAPGELARWTLGGVELLRADGAGLTPTDTVALGHAQVCAQVVSQANGAAVAAATIHRGDANLIRVALREPGGRFGAPVTLPGARGLAAAAGAGQDGSAVVAVVEQHRLVLFRRPAGGAFLPGERVTTWTERAPVDGVVAGVDASGRLTLAWARDLTDNRTVVEVAGADRKVHRIGPSAPIGGEPSLAVAPGGRALLAFYRDGAGVTVAEREPGAARFGAPHRVAPEGGDTPAAALADSGAAVLAWRTDEGWPPGVRVSTRAAAGPFGPARDAAPEQPDRRTRLQTSAGSVGYSATAPPVDTPYLRAAIAGPGFALAWADGLKGGGTGVPQAASGALAGGEVTRTELAAPVRIAVSLAPLALPDGRAAVAWADDAMADDTFASGAGRLHLALAGAAPAPDAPAPGFAPRLSRQRFEVDDPLVLPVGCDAACDVRATVAGQPEPVVAVGSLGAAGVLKLRLYQALRLLGRLGDRDVTVTLSVSAPGARTFATRRVAVPVRIVHSAPVPRLLDVRARRDGDDVVVTWRTSAAARGVLFVAVALNAHGRVVASHFLRGGARRAYRVRVRDAAQARRIILGASSGSDRRPRRVTLRVTTSGGRA